MMIRSTKNLQNPKEFGHVMISEEAVKVSRFRTREKKVSDKDDFQVMRFLNELKNGIIANGR